MTDWNPELDSLARSMWSEGQSAGKIASVIGRSRNSVISRARRSNWGAHQAASKISGRCRVKAKTQPKKAERRHKPPRLAPAPLHVAPPPPPNFDVTKVEFIAAAARQCKFIFNDCSPWFACGSPAVSELPYCEYHCRICYAGRR